MHTEVCDSCRSRPTVWRVELDGDLDEPERVSFDVCDSCITGWHRDDPNLTLTWLGDTPTMGVSTIQYGVAATPEGRWIGIIQHYDGETDTYVLPDAPDGWATKAEAQAAIVPILRQAVLEACEEDQRIHVLGITTTEDTDG